MERKQQVEKEGKATCRTRRKRSMQEENPHARRQTSLTILSLGFSIRVVMTIRLQNNISKILGGLG